VRGNNVSWNSIDLQKAVGMSPFCFNGEEPQSAGEPCTGLALQYFFDGSQIQVNVVHLRIGDQWHRMYFEPATVFWRKSEMPEPAQNTELTYGLLLNDLTGVEGFVGHAFQRIEYRASERGDVEVDIAFSSGRHLRLAYNAHADHAQVVNN
jgi:hypothetical protein